MTTRSRTCLTLALLLALGAPILAGADWSQQGNSLNLSPDQHGFQPSLAFSGDTAYVAWSENGAVHVKYYNGASWVSLAAALNVNPAHAAGNPQIGFSGATPYVAFLEDDGAGNHELFVKHYSGAAWVQDGGALNTPGQTANLSRLRFSGSTPYVAWVENYGTLFVKRYSAGAWTQVGSGPVSYAAAITGLGFALDSGQPYLAYIDCPGLDQEVWVKHYNGSDWQALGSSLNAYAMVRSPTIAFSGGNPHVAWEESNGTVHQARVKFFNGASWQALGGSLNIDPNWESWGVEVAVVTDTPYVIWSEQNSSFAYLVHVKRYNGSAWETVGGSLNNGASTWAIAANLAFSGSGAPHAAFQENDTGYYQIYVKQYLTPTATATPTLTRTMTATLSRTATRTVTATPSATQTLTPTPSITTTATALVSTTVTPSSTFTTTPTATRTASATGTATVVVSATATASATLSATATAAVSRTPTPGITLTLAATRTATPVTRAWPAVSEPLAYPNPARETVSFLCPEADASSLRVVVYNVLGEQVALLEAPLATGRRLDWDVRTLSPGVYLYRMTVLKAGEEKRFGPKKLTIARP